MSSLSLSLSLSLSSVEFQLRLALTRSLNDHVQTVIMKMATLRFSLRPETRQFRKHAKVANHVLKYMRDLVYVCNNENVRRYLNE